MGQPEQKKFYDYMLSYSPYDNVAQAYPAMFVGTGLWDSQVQYYEPAKWVARLRELNTDAPLLFRTNMEAGHGGKSGRFRRYRELAESSPSCSSNWASRTRRRDPAQPRIAQRACPQRGDEHGKLGGVDGYRVARERERPDEDGHRETDAAQQAGPGQMAPARCRRAGWRRR